MHPLLATYLSYASIHVRHLLQPQPFRQYYRLLPFLFFALSSLLTAAEKPNILFIYTDDHSYRTLSCYEGAESWYVRG
jgi:hypothetical protein